MSQRHWIMKNGVCTGKSAIYDVDMMCLRLQTFSEASTARNVFFSKKVCLSDFVNRFSYAGQITSSSRLD